MTSEEILWQECVACFAGIERLSGRKEIILALSSFFGRLKRYDLEVALYLAIARISSESAGIEMNTGEFILLRALSMFSASPVESLREKAKSAGDISVVVKARKGLRLAFGPKTKKLTLAGVFNRLQGIARITGKEAAKRKTEEIAVLLSECQSDDEIKYLIRLVDGKLKIGISTQTALCALGHCMANSNRIGLGRDGDGDGEVDKDKKVSGDIDKDKNKDGDMDKDGDIDKDGDMDKNGEVGSTNEVGGSKVGGEEIEWRVDEEEAMEKVKQAYAQLPSFSRIVEVLFAQGLGGLDSSLVTPGYPLRPMLALAEKGPDLALARFKEGSFVAEYKYDGERIQIHSVKQEIKLFSRGLELITERYAAVIAYLKKAYPGPCDYILDGEVVAYDRVQDKTLSFQMLSNRKRKLTEENKEKEEADVALFLFDIIFFDQPLIKLPLLERKAQLAKHFQPVPGEVFLVTAEVLQATDIDRMNTLFSQALLFGCEGLMLKSTGSTSTYEPSKRSQKWVKLKSDYIQGMHDTFDLIVVGAYAGKGKRTGVHGGFLLGCLNEEGEVQTLTKIGTGFSEAFLQAASTELEAYKSSTPTADISGPPQPDIWFKPQIIWEVAAASISLSPKYTAAKNSPELPEGKGLSLRFPRFIRKREDKPIEAATTSAQILDQFLASTSA
ncbi:DNA ligase 1 [Nematocida homosporus]|uniref:DNA ligase 1 n=1 Tax=Nematocida homosporus TaxID=1912981 RepID=UPI00221EB1B2|nr:DNA ligase 1 [Nematocida homosporus]KAI5187577.1 DNA ligase 1 [Nematocida homosporus]